MQQSVSVVVALLMCASAPFAGAAESSNKNTESQISDVLVKEFRGLMSELIEQMKTDRRVPHDITPAEIKEKVDTAVETYSNAHVFDVNAAQAEKFKAAEFNDKENIQRLNKMIRALKDSKADLPITTVYAVKHLQAGDLKGARLELCVRLVQLNVDMAKRALREK